MLLSEQPDLIKALLAAAGITNATEFDVHAGWLIVDGVPHRLSADGIDPTAPVTPPAPVQADPDLLEALKQLTLCARTSGGVAGPDAGLMDACAVAEAAIAKATSGEPAPPPPPADQPPAADPNKEPPQ